jgi:hypothetical protein
MESAWRDAELLVFMKEPMKPDVICGMLKKNERSRRFIRTSFKVQEELMEFHL